MTAQKSTARDTKEEEMALEGNNNEPFSIPQHTDSAAQQITQQVGCCQVALPLLAKALS